MKIYDQVDEEEGMLTRVIIFLILELVKSRVILINQISSFQTLNSTRMKNNCNS